MIDPDDLNEIIGIFIKKAFRRRLGAEFVRSSLCFIVAASAYPELLGAGRTSKPSSITRCNIHMAGGPSGSRRPDAPGDSLERRLSRAHRSLVGRHSSAHSATGQWTTSLPEMGGRIANYPAPE